VPNLNGVNATGLSRLWPVFALLNLSLLWRVAGEIAGDFDPALLAGLHWSGVMAGVALLLWAGHLLRVMFKPPVQVRQVISDIDPQTHVAAVIETWPQTTPVFVRHGFGLLLNPVARRTIARAVSIDHACRMHNEDVSAFVRELRVAAGLEEAHECACSTALLDPEASVAETAVRHPATVAVFARLGLDACCGGAESIRNAAAHNNKPLEEVLHQLSHAIHEEHHDEAGTACAGNCAHTVA